MQYMIIAQENTEVLGQEVNNAIQDGWLPQGGVCAMACGYAYPNDYKGGTEVVEHELFCQAMIKDGPQAA